MPSMSYCANRNTNIELRQILSNMREFDSVKDYADSLSEDERRAFNSIIDKCQLISEIVEDEQY